MNFRRLLLIAASAFWLVLSSTSMAQPAGESVITVDARAPAKPFPHFWEQSFGSGRAILVLRAAYQEDLRRTKEATDLRYVRFHGILNDEVGVYDEDENGRPVYNFTYVSQIYDALLRQSVRPIVELSFMPKKLAAGPEVHPFWYKPSPSPPRDWKKWEELVYQFTRHLVDRYGIDEVAQWYFEVWNEPNWDFWTGDPKREMYFRLYEGAARAVKRVDPRLRVGGPATAQAQWVPEFIKRCVENNVPLDFISTHVYGSDPRENVFGTKREVPQNKMVCMTVAKTHSEVEASQRPDLPIFYTEYNFGGTQENTAFMAPWLASVLRDCDGLVDQMSFWVFSEVFEEGGVPRKPFDVWGGTIAQYNLPKSSFYAFLTLHKLGTERLPLETDSVLVTRRKDGALVIAAWNLPPEPGQRVAPRDFRFRFAGIRRGAKASIWRVDENHGNLLGAWEKLGRPAYPTMQQQEQLRRESGPGPPRVTRVGPELKVTVPGPGLAVIEVK